MDAPPGPRTPPEARRRVTALYEAWGKPEKAEEWRRKVGPGGSPPGPPGRESKQE